MRWRSGLLVNEGWTGQRNKLTYNMFTIEIWWALLEYRVEVLSHYSNQSLARSQPLGRCNSLWLRGGPRKALSLQHQQQLSGAAGVLVLTRSSGGVPQYPHIRISLWHEKKAGWSQVLPTIPTNTLLLSKCAILCLPVCHWIFDKHWLIATALSSLCTHNTSHLSVARVPTLKRLCWMCPRCLMRVNKSLKVHSLHTQTPGVSLVTDEIQLMAESCPWSLEICFSPSVSSGVWWDLTYR